MAGVAQAVFADRSYTVSLQPRWSAAIARLGLLTRKPGRDPRRRHAYRARRRALPRHQPPLGREWSCKPTRRPNFASGKRCHDPCCAHSGCAGVWQQRIGARSRCRSREDCPDATPTGLERVGAPRRCRWSFRRHRQLRRRGVVRACIRQRQGLGHLHARAPFFGRLR